MIFLTNKKKNLRMTSIAVFLFVLMTSTLYGNETTEQGARLELDLKTVLESTIKHHPEVLQAIETVRSSESDQLSAKGNFDPKIYSYNQNYSQGYYSGYSQRSGVELPLDFAYSKVFGEYRNGSGNFPVYEDEYKTLSNGEGLIGFEFDILQNFQIDNRRFLLSQSNLEYNRSVLELQAVLLALAQEAGVAYWKWIVQGSIVKIYQELLSVAEQRQGQLNTRLKKGDLAEFEVNDNKRNIFQRKEKLLFEEFLFKQASQELSMFYRNENGRPAELNMSLLPEKRPVIEKEFMSIEEALKMALERQPAYAALDVEIQKLNQEATLYKNQILPRLTLKNTLSQDSGSGSYSREGTEWKTYLQFEVPMFQRVARGKYSKMEAKIRQIKQKQKLFEDKMKIKINTLLAQLENTLQRAKVLNSEAELTTKLEKGELLKFKSGDSTLLFVAIRELASAEVKIAQLKNLATNLAAQTYLDYSLGRLISKHGLAAE